MPRSRFSSQLLALPAHQLHGLATSSSNIVPTAGGEEEVMRVCAHFAQLSERSLERVVIIWSEPDCSSPSYLT